MGPISPDDLRFNRFGLSQQESRVLALAMSGRIDKMIASEMGISLGTVRVYWKRIRQKVGGTRSEVIAELARSSLKLNFDDERDRATALQVQLEASMVREQALRVYETAFSSYPTALAILDGPTGHILSANDAFAELHGYEADELVDVASESLIKPGDLKAFEKESKSAGPGNRVEIATTRVRKDGSTFGARAQLSGGEGAWVLAIKA